MDDKDVIIAQLMAEIQQLRAEIQSLRDENTRLKKDSNNSSKPPSSDIVKPKRNVRKKVKRKRGAQKGHKKNGRKAFTSEQIDETIEYEFIAADAVGLIPLNEWHSVQQVSLPEKLYCVTEHKARKYLDPKTGRIHIAPLPDEVRQGGLLAADMTTAVAYMKGKCHMSFSTIQSFFKEVVGLQLSRGLLCKTVLKVSDALQTPYDHLKSKLPQENYLGIDETGHKDNKKLRWSWCFQTSHYSLFHIGSRKCDVLIEILGKNFKGIIGCDYYGAYRKYSRLFNALMQYCLAHLIREIRFLAEHSNKTLVRWGKKLLEWLKKMFDTLHKRYRYSQKGYEQKMKKIKQGFLKQVRRPVDHQLARKLARRFKAKAANHYFRFLTDPNVEPTNNGTEREIRHLVIDRRITQGTRGEAGMRWCERIWTTLATCRKKNRSAFDFIHNAIINYWKRLPSPQLV
jgi:transposase